ncbi:MAG TPA: RNA polymerase sigma-70 factor [Dehalococcoidia bacterium]|nr:RNA polymerase sigma-70 factor [Dehalococcoidia bacterium]
MPPSSPDPAEATGVDAFEAHRRFLFSIAYRMLGSVTDAEDVVQEAYLRYRATPPETIRSLKSFLTTVVTRLCLDQLKSARVRRETYVGPWLPAPLPMAGDPVEPSPDDRVEATESISMAFLILLESLTPVERAIFLLREVFDVEYPEIAEIVGRREDACRQSFHRAKQRIEARRPRFRSTPAEGERLATGFLQAVEAGDLAGLTRLLADDISVWTDGGGKAAAATRPVLGRENAGRFLIGLASKAAAAHFESIEANGCPAVIVRADNTTIAVAVLEVDDHQVRAIRIVANPDKLTHLSGSSR